MDAKETYDVAAERIVAKLQEMGIDEPTPNDMIDASESLVRQEIYERYWCAKPEVVEALLLMQRQFFEDINAEIEAVSDEASLEVLEDRIVIECHRFTKALRQTIALLYTV